MSGPRIIFGGSKPKIRASGPPTPVAKQFRAGTHRARSPVETVEWLRGLMPVMGITRIADVTGLDVLGIPVVMAIRPNARSLSVSQGKGVSLEAAKASGLMEAVELWHAEHILTPLTLASFDDIRFQRHVVDIAKLPKPRDSQFHPGVPLLWIEGRDLADGSAVQVPFELVHTNYTLPPLTGAGMFLASSTGLAGGNHPLEALCHALCEVVERDADTLWTLLPAEDSDVTAIDLDSIVDEGSRNLLDICERAGVEVRVWDITSDVGIAAFRCSIADRDESGLRRLGVAAGMGCHPTREIALARAITEAAQSRLTLIAGSRDDITRDEYAGTRDRRTRAPARRRFDSVPTFEASTFDEDIAHILGRLRAVGIEQAIVVDLSRREFRIPVARVIVPGLEATRAIPTWSPGARARAHARLHAGESK